ncbi:MAG: TlpA family protein disulfide reductase [Burkholderiaceae bacterium]|nr:TlpA family protein disulfide reductase [Burkholderiaceae bacterium]
MQSVALGPLAIPLSPLLILLAALLALGITQLRLRRQADGPSLRKLAGDVLLNSAFFGLLLARLAYVAQHAQAYLANPWALLDIRDGGWNAMVGWFAAVAFLVWIGRRQANLRPTLAVAALAAATFWLTATGFIQAPRPDRPSEGLFQALDGGPAKSLVQAAQGKPMVLNLWASWCGPCRQEMPLLTQAQVEHPELSFVFVNQGESASAVQTYLASQRFALNGVLLDPASALGPALGSRGLPTTIFYDANGRMVDAHMGVLNAATLSIALRKIQNQGRR